jgi:hypothetical protein
MIVHLNEHEMMLVKLLGLLRHHANISAKTIDRKRSSENGEDIHITGVMAEYAFCKWKNVFMDCSTENRSGSYDVLCKGLRIDIKATKNQNGNLICQLKQNLHVDIYILALINQNSVEFIGWISSMDLRKEENIKDLSGNGSKCYFMPREKLKKIPKD